MHYQDLELCFLNKTWYNIYTEKIHIDICPTYIFYVEGQRRSKSILGGILLCQF